MTALLVFLDGLGLGEADPAVNPVAAARLPCLRALLGGARPLLPDAGAAGPGATLLALDALLGVHGLPQSGTGQAALLTGRNAPALFGRHFGPWVPVALRPLVARQSILARTLAAGRGAAFANAYPEELLAATEAADPPGAPKPERGSAPAAPSAEAEAVNARLRRLPGPLRAGPPLAALAAGLLTRHTDALRNGDAVASEIDNEGWRERLGRRDLPVVTPQQAGATLARITAGHDMTLFAHYSLDYIGHRGGFDEAVAALERVDAFLGGLVEALPPDALLVVAADHGNIEDVRTEHTRNPALGLVAGLGRERAAARLRSLTDVAGILLEAAGGPAAGG